MLSHGRWYIHHASRCPEAPYASDVRADGVNHHDHDRIVELCRTPNRFEADVIVARLTDAGITASVNYGGFGSTVPHYSFADGNAVLVFDCDLDRARDVLADTEPV